MSARHGLYGLLRAIFSIVVDVVFFWQFRLYTWWTKGSPKQAFLETLQDAKIFEEWEAAALQLDELLGNDLWRQNPTSKYYDYRLIYERLQGIVEAREDEDILGLVNLLRSGLVRNLGNITAPQLFSRAYVGTKLLIQEYINQVALAIEHVTVFPASPGFQTGLTNQAKLDLLHDTRQAFGRSALVLQGGAIFGLCHLGVVKALHLQGLLPRIIAGTATGALIAALVGVHNEEELLEFLTGEGINLSAFAAQTTDASGTIASVDNLSWLGTLVRRFKRFFNEGYFLDAHVLEECVRDNVGDLTFEEAYIKTKRVLNITVPTDRSGGVPSLLNYLTAPNVLIWSAAVASQASSPGLYSPVTLLCKSASGKIHPWSTTPRSQTPGGGASASSVLVDLRNSPLSRIAELFNVNHFVVSQARPYIAPFLQTGDVLSHTLPRRATMSRRGRFWLPLPRLFVLEIQHRLRQLDALGLLHSSIRRFLVDEIIPGTSITLVPELSAGDFVRLLERPNKQIVDDWILRGEKSVWPAIGAIRIRCAVEVALDRGYQVVRRRKPMDAGDSIVRAGSNTNTKNAPGNINNLKGSGEKRKRSRANSLGGGRKREAT